jgi:hypothetical protein
MSNWTSRAASALAIAAGLGVTGTASAQNGWTAVKEIVGQTSTGTVATGGDPKWLAPKPQYSGAVGLLMDYGAAGAFVCSGSLINRYTVVTAAHCVSDGTAARPNSTTVFFYGGQDDPALYANGSPATRIAVSKYTVHQDYTGEVVDQNDIAVLRLAQDAPDFAPAYALSNITDLTGVDHTIAGYGLRSTVGGSQGTLTGFAAGTGRLRYADNRFDFRFGDADFNNYWDGYFGTADSDHVWISDFDNGTTAKDGSCNAMVAEGFAGAVFSSSKYCDLGRGDREGIGAGGDSGAGYFVDGQLVAVHSFALWYNADESANRFGQLKGAVSIDFHRQFINNAIPEPATWAMMIAGFGLAGTAVRRRARMSVTYA